MKETNTWAVRKSQYLIISFTFKKQKTSQTCFTKGIQNMINLETDKNSALLHGQCYTANIK